MNRMMNNIWQACIAVIFLSCFGHADIYASSADSCSTRATHSLGIELRPAWVVPTNDYFRKYGPGENIKAALSPHIKYGFQFAPDTHYGRLYPHARQGAGLSYTQFFNKTSLGHPVTLYIFQSNRLAHLSDRLSLDYEWNFGVSSGWKKFNVEWNMADGPVGSKVNAYLNLGIILNYRLSPQCTLTAGVEGSHYSNGNTHLPNSGINTLGARIGVSYLLGIPSGQQDLPPLPIPEVEKGFSYDLTVYGATRQRTCTTYIEGEPSEEEYVPGSFGVAGLNFAPMYTLSRYWRVGLSADFQYDESANISQHRVDGSYGDDIKFYRQPFKERFSAGLSVRAELTMPIFSINFGIGRNVIATGRDTSIFYQTLSLKAYVIKNAYINIGYQLRDFHLPNNLMLGVGYSFGLKR